METIATSGSTSSVILELLGFIGVILAALVGFSGVIWTQRKSAMAALQRDATIRRDDAEALAVALRGEISAIREALAFRQKRFAEFARDYGDKRDDLPHHAGMLRMPPQYVYPANTDRLGLLGSKLPQHISLFYAQIGLLDETTDAALKGHIPLRKRSEVFGKHAERATILLKNLEMYLEGNLLSEEPLHPLTEGLEEPRSEGPEP